MKLLVDMNLSPRWVAVLVAAGYQAEHWSTLGPVDAPDGAIMAFALAHDYIVLTHDLDFSAILAATQGRKPSVVQIRADDVSPSAIADSVLSGLRQVADELEQGALLTINPRRSRLHLLPLTPR
ncbi:MULTISPECIES: DUF5615 family PIN-like protein [Nitrospirillum]|uniref:DUF5615 family PIN-like protein n=1 Tax=Nitrospirillum amazonense TaxID=28077 RepID=UPI0011A7D7C2|nr:DUF5615 family PIN-like protein [Nitrospirillum amazonense]MEC4590797.1 DUF5615 family PIN-like protein [Nitrospirillum amazonense]